MYALHNLQLPMFNWEETLAAQNKTTQMQTPTMYKEAARCCEHSPRPNGPSPSPLSFQQTESIVQPIHIRALPMHHIGWHTGQQAPYEPSDAANPTHANS